MAVKKEDTNRVFAESPEEQKSREDADVAARVKYKNDALAARAAKFKNTETPMAVSEIRQARQQVIDAHVTLISPDNDSQVKPIDNPIPVRHDGEEPGETDKGEAEHLVKIREDVKDFTPQPEGHRVPEADQLHGETGDGGVMPVEARAANDHPLAEGKDVLANDQTGESGTHENDPAAKDAGETDPDGKNKGLKKLADGTTLDAEGDKHAKQPEGHDPSEAKVAEPEQEDPEVRLTRLREEYKKKFGKTVNARWSADHLQDLIDEKV